MSATMATAIHAHRVRPPIIAGSYLVAAAVSHLALPMPRVIPPPYHYAGLALVGAGCALTVWALRQFKRRETTHDPYGAPTTLVTSGPFQRSRNPMYLGVTTVLLGIATLGGSLPLFLAPLAFFLTINAAFVPYEEAKLQQTFGQAYRDYKARVRRWL